MKTQAVILISIFSFLIITCSTSTEPVYEYKPEMVKIYNNLTFTLKPLLFYNPYGTDSIITLEPFEIGKYEITNLEYYQFVQDSGYSNSTLWSDEGWAVQQDTSWKCPRYWDTGDVTYESDPYLWEDDTPVHGICYYEAEAYCIWLSM